MEIGKQYTYDQIMGYKEENKIRGIGFSTSSLKVGELEFIKNEDGSYTLESTRESRIENQSNVSIHRPESKKFASYYNGSL